MRHHLAGEDGRSVDLASYRAWLFDLDGVLTKTAEVHAAAWQQAFDEFLETEASRLGTRSAPFDPVGDYERYVDGEPREDGVRNFLAARDIELPEGTDDDPSDARTVKGVGNHKNELVLEMLRTKGVEVYEGAIALVRALRAERVPVAVVSASENTRAALEAAGIAELFDVVIDGHVVKERHLAGKPAPDSYLAGASALDVDAASAVVVEDALAGVESGRAGHFGLVVGVDHHDHAEELRTHGADVVVTDLAELLGEIGRRDDDATSSSPARERSEMTANAEHGVDRTARVRIVVVGGGFAGLNATHALRDLDAEVTLVDRNNYHTFQPLLYQVSTGYLAPEEVGTTLRSVFRRQENTTVRTGAVASVDWSRRRAILADGAALEFDYLILTAGAETNFFRVDGMEEHAWPLYTLNDAIALRMHLLGALEQLPSAERDGRFRLAAVVVGGGPTGVETAGALASMAQEVVGPNVQLQVTLVEAGPRLLGSFASRSSSRALADLRRRGVDVRLGQAVERSDATGVTLSGGERIATSTVIWAAGVKANELGGALGLAVNGQGRVVVDAQLRVVGHDGVFAAGDFAAAGIGGERLLPMLAPVAIQTGRHAGEQVVRLVQGRPLRPLRYHDKGMMAVLGRGDAVAELPMLPGGVIHRSLRLGGMIAWLLWLVVHIAYLIGFRNRLKVLIDWGWSYFTSRGAGAILVDMAGDRRS